MYKLPLFLVFLLMSIRIVAYFIYMYMYLCMLAALPGGGGAQI